MGSLHQHTTTVWTHAGTMLRREGNAQPGPPHPAGVYPSKDGYVFLCHSGAWKLVPFVEALGQAQIFGDPRFATDASRALHKREFDAVLNERLTELTTEEIIEIGVATRSPLGPVPPILEVFEDSQLEARNFWVELGNEKALRFPRGPFAIEGHPSGPATLPLETGELALEALLDEWTAEERGGGGEQLSDGPLQGLRVLDMTRVWSGPIAGRLLGDLGANSILIESPWNRGIRHPDPEASFFTHPDNERGEHPWNRAGGFNKLARNKRSLTLDMKKERAREVFAELVKQADVVLENYSPRVMPQFGFDFESLKKRPSHHDGKARFRWR